MPLKAAPRTTMRSIEQQATPLRAFRGGNATTAMSDYFNVHEFGCWITGGKPDSKFSRPPAPPPKRKANGQWAKRIRRIQVGSRGVVHPATLTVND